MRFLAVLNRDGGTLKTTDLDALVRDMRAHYEAAGHGFEARIVRGRDVGEALSAAAERDDVDVVIAGGGDGTVSTAAAALSGKDKALAVLPAGTMNLFARSLGVPLSLQAASTCFADGKVVAVDLASANGRPFVHQFSIGLHAKVVHLRSRYQYASRLGKMWASLRAGLAAMARPPSMDVSLDMGETRVEARTTGIGVSNNVFGEGHLPYADRPDAGVLGIYVASAGNRLDVALIFLAMAIGRWRDTEQVEIHETEGAVLTIGRHGRRFPCVIDGELCRLEKRTVLKIHPGALKVVVPPGSHLHDGTVSDQPVRLSGG